MLPAGSLTGPMELVSSYDTYVEAQTAVDSLADRKFPVERLTIVAGNLRFVEQVTGRLGYGGAMVQGAASGGLVGAVLGFILGLFGMVTPLISGLLLAFWGLLIGAIIGGIIGLIGHAMMGGQRDFSSVAGFQAGRYDLMAAADAAGEARRLLSGVGLAKTA
jgi:hypothetical protein